MCFPFLSVAILIALCGVFAAEQVFAVTQPKGLWDVSVATLHAMGGLSQNAVLQGGEWYRFFSAPLLHADLMHLLFNGGALIFAGLYLERIIGRAWYGASYVVGGLTGALFSCFLNKPEVVAVGASGAITGLFATLCIVSFLYEGKDRQRLQTNAMQILAPAILPILWKTTGNVDYWAHIGGALGGAAVGFFLLRNWSHAVEPRLRSLATTVSIAGFVLAVATSIPIAQGYFSRGVLIPPDQFPKSTADGKVQSEHLVTTYPRDPRAHLYRAFALAEKNDLENAAQELRVALALKDMLPLISPLYEPMMKALLKSALYEHGLALQRQDEVDRAIAALDESIAINVAKLEAPELQQLQAAIGKIRAHSRRGLLYYLKEDYARAFEDFDEEIRLHPQDHLAYWRRGRARFHSGDYRLAIADFRKSTEADPATEKDYAHYVLWLHMAQVRAQESDKSDLISVTRTITDKKWPSPIIEFYLDKITLPALRAAATNSDERCEADFYLAEWHLMRGEKDRAITLLRSAKEGCSKSMAEYTAAIIELRNLNIRQ